MRVFIYTLTRDRLEYTQRSFESLRQNAGYPYEHIVVDNGSTDGTVDWLAEQIADGSVSPWSIFLHRNEGISAASNRVLEFIADHPLLRQPDLIVKMDNDCLIKTPDLLRRVVDCYEELAKKPLGPTFLLSPVVIGINNQPAVGRLVGAGTYTIKLTAIVGGLFHVVPAAKYLEFRYPSNLPLARGQDDAVCRWWKGKGGEVGYIDPLIVEHMDGTDAQAEKYPEYFKRKYVEEKQLPPPSV